MLRNHLFFGAYFSWIVSFSQQENSKSFQETWNASLWKNLSNFFVSTCCPYHAAHHGCAMPGSLQPRPWPISRCEGPPIARNHVGCIYRGTCVKTMKPTNWSFHVHNRSSDSVDFMSYEKMKVFFFHCWPFLEKLRLTDPLNLYHLGLSHGKGSGPFEWWFGIFGVRYWIWRRWPWSCRCRSIYLCIFGVQEVFWGEVYLYKYIYIFSCIYNIYI